MWKERYAQEDLRRNSYLCCGCSARAQDAYVVGLTGADRPPSSTYAPSRCVAHLYYQLTPAAASTVRRSSSFSKMTVRSLKGGRPMKKLITGQRRAVVTASLSSTYAPMIAETKAAGVLLLFASGVCPRAFIRRPTHSSARPATPPHFDSRYLISSRRPRKSR